MLLIDSAARLIEIRDNSNSGALGPASNRVCRLPRARAPLKRDGAWLPGSVIAVISEPCIRLGVRFVVSRGLRPFGAEWSMAAWICERSNKGAIDSS
jgi:hypothetical protein